MKNATVGTRLLIAATFLLGLVMPAAAQDVEFGLIQPITGQGAFVGQSFVKGVDLGLDVVNSQGGVLGGRKLKYMLEDDRCTPPETVSAAKKLIDQQGLKILMGSMCSSTTLAILPVTQQADVVHLVPISYAPNITEQGHPRLFRTCSNSAILGKEWAAFMQQKIGKGSIAMLSINDDFGRGDIKTVAANLEAMSDGPKVVSTDFFEQDARDFTTILTRIKARKPDAVYIIARIPQNAMIVNQMQEINFKPVIFGSTNFADSKFIELAGQNAEGIYANVTWTKLLDTAENQRYLAAYAKKYGGEPSNEFASMGWNAVMVLADAINRAGTAGDVAKLTASLRQTNMNVVNGRFTFDSTGQANLGAIQVRIKNGEFRPVN
ncbi:MAG: ABC transporter substrate-binding protein [Candidatus Lambdaproteobacteria bacterium]|nr:ABC transporter substrate-binding protein [Candidatus Lambdaproteobacteria bacterium]